MIFYIFLILLLSSYTFTSNLVCNSLQEFEPFDNSLYFACTCPKDEMEGQFSLASFAYNLSHTIFDRSLVLDIRDCWSMDIIMDQLQLNLVLSDYFRPDIQFKEINVENIFQVHLVQDQHSTPISDYINYPTHQLNVHLYDVDTILVDTEAQLDHLSTDWEETKLHVDLTTQNIESQDYQFDISGFKQSNIFFITDGNKAALNQMSEFQDVFHGLRRAVLTRSKQMSLGLSLCVFILTLGVGAMMLAIIKRHQLLIESVVYSSIGSLKRMKAKRNANKEDRKVTIEKQTESHSCAKSDSNNEVTTTTQVDFFPRYSVVNKSQRGVPRHLKEKKTVEASLSINHENVPREDKARGEHKAKSHATSINEIFSTLKFKSNRKPQAMQEKVPKSEPNKPGTSFYYQPAGASSSYSSASDLAGDTTTRTQVQAQVHQAGTIRSKGKYPDAEEEKSSSPQPLLPSEKIYSFRALQEKCRKMIAGSKLLQDNTKL